MHFGDISFGLLMDDMQSPAGWFYQFDPARICLSLLSRSSDGRPPLACWDPMVFDGFWSSSA